MAPPFSGSNTCPPNRRSRPRAARAEATEAEEYAKELGVHTTIDTSGFLGAVHDPFNVVGRKPGEKTESMVLRGITLERLRDRDRLRQQLDELTNAEATGARLRKEANAARKAFMHAADGLSATRREAASAFAAEVTGAMRGLGMPEGVFEIELRRREPEDAGPSGMDEITYLISANAGQPPMPLSRVASGGELSRMSLAIQVIASDGSAIPTMVFDEVDAGVGGGVAEMVGRRLMALGKSRQVLCVTHLPQVASLADNHFRVAKLSDGKSTRTTVVRLTDDERVEEIARMLGGVKITRRTRDHAAEMLAGSLRKPGKAAL